MIQWKEFLRKNKTTTPLAPRTIQKSAHSPNYFVAAQPKHIYKCLSRLLLCALALHSLRIASKIASFWWKGWNNGKIQITIILWNLVIVNKPTVKQVKIINKNAMRFPRNSAKAAKECLCFVCALFMFCGMVEVQSRTQNDRNSFHTRHNQRLADCIITQWHMCKML